MSWYWWILIAILGLNAFAIVMLGAMMISDWFAQRRAMRGDHRAPRQDSPES